MLLNILAVGAGGFIGSSLRYMISLIKVNESFVFPIKTLSINIIGCFVMGLIVAIALNNSNFDERLNLFLKVGICGGFTTFSTFAAEFTDLYKSGNKWIALAYAILTVCLSIAAVFSAKQIANLIIK